MRCGLAIAAISCAVIISACGSYIPAIDPTFDDNFKAAAFINSVVRNVRCQLGNAVLDSENGAGPSWLKNWSAEVTLSLNISEKTSLTPGVTPTVLSPSAVTNFANKTTVTTPQTFSFGLGAGYTGTAGRIVALTWSDKFSEFHGQAINCDAGSAIQGDLKLKEVLFATVFVGTVPGNMSKEDDPNGPYQNVQDTISFEIDTNANATPTWKYVNVAANTTGTLISIDRDRKDQLLITMGPPGTPGGKKSGASSFGANDVTTIHNIGRITLPIQ